VNDEKMMRIWLPVDMLDAISVIRPIMKPSWARRPLTFSAYGVNLWGDIALGLDV